MLACAAPAGAASPCGSISPAAARWSTSFACRRALVDELGVECPLPASRHMRRRQRGARRREPAGERAEKTGGRP